MIKSKQIKRNHLVLVVDDQEINRDVLGSFLEDEYDIIYAENGEEALRIIRENAQTLSIILLDLMMPVMNGFTVLEIVRNDRELNHIPIIVLTAEKQAELKALQMGAADFITKPFDMHEVILARVSRIIELSEGRQLISHAEHDELTGLYSRNFFFEYANRIYQYHPEWHMDAIVINIDSFHSINAMNGRDFGNHILQIIGDEIQAFLSENKGIASRLEADRFYILCSPQEDYQALLDRFQSRIDEHSPNVNVRLRMGVKRWEKDLEPVVIFDQAQAACSRIRGNYITHLMIYNEEMRQREHLDQRLMNDLRQAVDDNQLIVYYQPKYAILTQTPHLSSAEALIRWNHPELGMIPPGNFIPLFESTGQISTIDYFVWSEAARQVAEWRDKFGITIPVSVNLSRVDTFDPELENILNHLITENNLNPEDLKIEVTESAYTENEDKLIEVVTRLRELGFEVEMDDFGSGYSSLNMLSSMPIDVLKMDMKFIQNIEYSEKDLKLVKLVLDIAKYLNLKVVAEGVETETQLNILKESRCDLIQGYYFSRPVPPGEFEKFIIEELKLRNQEA